MNAAVLPRALIAAKVPFSPGPTMMPVTTASYQGIPPDKTNQASALINVARNLGGSMGVAMVQTVWQQRQQFHQSRLVEHIVPSDVGYQQTIDAMTRFFQARGSNASDAASQAIAWVGQSLQQQINLLAYMDAFWSLAMVGLVMIPLAFAIKTIDLRAPAKGH